MQEKHWNVTFPLLYCDRVQLNSSASCKCKSVIPTLNKDLTTSEDDKMQNVIIFHDSCAKTSTNPWGAKMLRFQ